MSVFSEYLSKLLQSRNLSATKAAELIGISKTILINWCEGKYLPKDYNRLVKVADALCADARERKLLREYYERCSLGEDYEVFQKLFDILDTLKLSGEHVRQEMEGAVHEEYSIELPAFVEMNNQLQILTWIEKLFLYAGQKEQAKVELWLVELTQEVLLLLKLLCNRNKGCEIEMLLHISKERYEALYGLEVLKGVSDILVQNSFIKIKLCVEGQPEDEPGVNYIFAGGYCLRYDSAFSHGMLTSDGVWVSFYRKELMERGDGLVLLDKKKCGPLDTIAEYDAGVRHAYTFEYMACMTVGLTREILEKCFYEDIENREAIIESIAAVIIFHEDDPAYGITNIFNRQGILDFMNSGVFGTFPYQIYEPLTIPMRCQVLQNVIRFARTGDISFYMLDETCGMDMKDVMLSVNQTAKGINLKIATNFFVSEERFDIYDRRIQKCFLDFIRYLTGSGYVCSKEETLDFMEKVLEYYEGQEEENRLTMEDWTRFYEGYVGKRE